MQFPSVVPAMILAAAVAPVSLGQVFWVPVSIAPFANQSVQARLPSLGSGPRLLGGVPFFIGASPNSAWNSGAAPGGNPRVLEVPINLRGAREVHTLINTDWGQAGGSTARVEFIGSGGLTHSVDLFGDVDIRDYLQNVYTNSINGTSTTQVLTDGNRRLDKQRFVLPAAFADADLLRVRLVDNGATNFQRTWIVGLSVAVDAPPLQVWSSALGGNDHRYTAVQTLGGITWADANAAAQQRGGYLATITSAAENNVVFSLIGGNQAFWRANPVDANNPLGPWIGGVQPAGSGEPAAGWSWANGEPWAYTNWAVNEPSNSNGNEDRAHFFAVGVPAANTWNDSSAATLLNGYIIEWNACLADVAGPNQSIGPDGALSADDIIVYLSWYFAADSRANVAGPNQSTVIDNQFTADDIIVYLSRYFQGC